MSKHFFKQIFFTVLLLTAAAAFQAKAEVKLPAVFGDNMVLQQQSQVAVWGWAKPNTTVKVSGSWNKKSYSTRSDEKGCWKVKIQTPAAGFTPYTLTVSDGQKTLLNNILIGEVWFCSGQSNMQMPMKGFNNQPIEDGPEVIAQSENPGIRCFTVQRAPKLLPHDDCSGIWELANEQTVPDFTAAGYFFARKLHASLNVPIGLISSSWGGSSIEAWMPSQTLTDIPEKTLPATEADIKTPPQTPTALYNGMVHPLVGYGIRGVIWYQGESNKEEPVLYVKMFDKMVREWRHLWGEGEFPFYYCQIAPFKYDSGLNSAYIREAQLKGMTTTPNTGMAVLMDANSPKGIHPAKKKDAGERLALWALAKTYGMDIPCRSPEMKSLDREGRLAIITFDYTGAGLTAPNKELKNFEIAGPDKSFHPATATLWDNKVYLFSPEVSEPVAVRYCWNDTSATELFSIEGNLPVSSFRTDEW